MPERIDRRQQERRRVNDVPARVRCPHCTSQDNRVLRVRCRRSDFAVLRRHLCEECGARFSSQQEVISN